MKTLSIIGATGSIGDSTFEVLRHFRNKFQVKLISGRKSWQKLSKLALEFKPETVGIADPEAVKPLVEALDGTGIKVACGQDELCEAIKVSKSQLTVSAIVGAAGLKPTMEAINSGSDIALANKESMVVAGAFMNAQAKAMGVQIIPVDSEHNALHQCLKAGKPKEVSKLILTASGGPFRQFEGDFSAITPQQALKHPTWKMGPKITIDSSTLMNKGLEVIEAYHLFGFSHRDISVVVHPQSVVHSMVEYQDGSIIAQLGRTHMCHPIQYALTYPDRWGNPFQPFSFANPLKLDFEPVNEERFPCLNLAFKALEKPSTLPCVLNAANEIAVEAFLNGRIKYTQIFDTVSQTMNQLNSIQVNQFDDIFVLDQEARNMASSIVESR